MARCVPFVGLPFTGITDSFDRPDDTVLGVADCGRTWTVQVAAPMSIVGNYGRAPTGIVAMRTSSLPGPWPVPFNGRIDFVGGDINPGFSFERDWDDELGFLEVNDGHCKVTGGELICGRYEAGMFLSNGIAELAGSALYVPGTPVTFTCHWRVTELLSGGSGPRVIDDYISISLATAGFVVEVVPKTGSPGVAQLRLVDTSDGGTTVLDTADYDPDFWHTDGEVDVSIAFDGSEVVATVGPLTVSGTLDTPSAVEHMAIGGAGFVIDAVNGDSCAQLATSNLLINGHTGNDFSFEWLLSGFTADFMPLTYRFGYVAPGGRLPPGVASLWPETTPTPAIYALVTDGTSSDLAIAPSGDIAPPFTPVVVINPGGASISIGALTASVANADAVPDALGNLDEFDSGLSMSIRNSQGDYVDFNDLDVVGVHADPGEPIVFPALNQPVNDDLVGVGDGVQTEFTTHWPYVDRSLRADVAGIVSEVDWTDPANGIFTLVDPAPAGAEVRATYTAIGV